MLDHDMDRPSGGNGRGQRGLTTTASEFVLPDAMALAALLLRAVQVDQAPSPRPATLLRCLNACVEALGHVGALAPRGGCAELRR